MVPWLMAGAAANPFIASAHRMQKLVGTFALPVLPPALAWDSFVSMLRMYSEAELFALVEGLDGFDWEYRALRPRAGVTITVFSGTPK